MEIFEYSRAETPGQAVAAGMLSRTAQQGANIRFIAGGTTLFDLMKLNVERPEAVVDINHLPLDTIERTPEGFNIGALVRNSDLAHHPEIQKDYPALSQALLSGASVQLRNRATTAGNLLQRTRCLYFRDTNMPCNKREPGSGCSALDGMNRMLAILGTSEHCIATNPSDMNVALMALDAVVHIQGAKGDRSVPIREFFLLPGETPHIENVLEPGDLVTHIALPALPDGTRSLYLKLRDRASYEFALASAAVVATVQDGKFAHIGIALGGVGTIPWRGSAAEAVLTGATPDMALFRQAAEAVLAEARPQSQNAFKIELAKRCLVQALTLATRSDQ